MKQVSAGIIICDGKILIARRRADKLNAELWEFPGGKQEPGETMPECLRREIREELHLDIEVGGFFMHSTYEYEQGAICLHVYYAYAQSRDICYHCDHDRLVWITPAELDNYQFSPADIPVKDALKSLPLPPRELSA